MTDPESALVYLLGKHSLLSPDDCGKIAKGIVKDLGLTVEEADVRGLEYMSCPQLFRWVSAWRRA